MSFRGRRGRRDSRVYPLLARCPECHHYIPSPEARGHRAHYPKCSEAPIQEQLLWARRDELRAMRTIGRMGE